MRLTQHFITLAIFPLFFMANRCVKDSEENNDPDTDVNFNVPFYQDEEVTKPMATENWEMFLKVSQDYIDTAETNIGALEIKIDEAESGDKTELQEVCDASNRALLILKSKRLKRNKEFEKEVVHYDRSVYERNETFEKEFRNEMISISSQLEKTLEKMRSGYYKTN